MDEPRTTRLVEAVLRCYPARWRERHGDEAAELAALADVRVPDLLDPLIVHGAGP